MSVCGATHLGHGASVTAADSDSPCGLWCHPPWSRGPWSQPATNGLPQGAADPIAEAGERLEESEAVKRR